MKTQNQWLFEAPFASEALFEFEALTREQMASFITKTWAANPILKRIGEIRDLRGADLSGKLNLILQQFQAVTGIKVEVVSDGAVQKLRGKGNFASLRSRPKFLQIEESVFRDPQKLLKEVQHELAFYFAGGSKGVPSLGNGPMNAMNFLEMMIQENGKLPSFLAEALRSSKNSEYEAEWLFEAPFTQKSLSAELESPDFFLDTRGGGGSGCPDNIRRSLQGASFAANKAANLLNSIPPKASKSKIVGTVKNAQKFISGVSTPIRDALNNPGCVSMQKNLFLANGALQVAIATINSQQGYNHATSHLHNVKKYIDEALK